ncbi:MAG: diguanylate cyclase, partial [Thermodesulfobacteriota bacterium]
YLLKSILADKEIKHLFIILSYRPNEIDNNHILYYTLEEIRNYGQSINEIELAPLDLENTTKFVNNFFNIDKDTLCQLSKTVFKKTNGNPFFILQFIKVIYEKDLITHDPHTGWNINLHQIKEMEVTNNVIDLLTEKISRLPEDIQEILKVCSCIGNRFDLETLSKFIDLPYNRIIDGIKNAAGENLIYYRNNMYGFYHDRIQEAAYSLIPNRKKKEIHYKIGLSKLHNSTEQDLNERIQDIVHHLNAGKNLIESEPERLRLTELNLQAGRKALDSAAFESAYDYLMTAVNLLQEDCFENNFEFSMAVYNDAAMAAYLNSDYNTVEQLSDKILDNTSEITQQLRIYEIKMLLYMARDQKTKAVKTALHVLEELGCSLPEYPKKHNILLSFLKLKLALTGKGIENIANLPVMKEDQNMLATIRMLVYFSPIAYWARPEAVPLISFKLVGLSLKYGLSHATPFSMASYGMILCSKGKYEQGYRSGRLSLKLLETQESPKLAPRTRFIFLTWIKHWKDSQQDVPRMLLENHQKAMEVGDLEFAAHALMVHSYQSLYAGFSLDTVEKNIIKNIETLKKLQQNSQLNLTCIYGQTVRNLLDKSEDPCLLIGDIYNENTMLPVHKSMGDEFAIHSVHAFKLILNYLFRNLPQALEASKLYLEHLGSSSKAVMTYVIWNFFDSLTRLGLCDISSHREKKRLLKSVKKNQEDMKTWANINPGNFLHKYYLVEAELARVKKDYQEAVQYFRDALSKSKENEYIQDEALANELAARYWIEQKNENYAKLHLKQALFCYTHWGSAAKVKQLRHEFQELIPGVDEEQPAVSTNLAKKSTQVQNLAETMDMTAVIKSTQALSSEIVLESLLEKMMKIAIEYAGAQRGIMFLQRNHEYYVEVEREASGNIEILNSIPLEKYDNCPMSIVNYVIKTQENVVLNNAHEDDRYFNDPYIVKNNTKSILCAPIRNKGKSSGLVYLENNYVSNAFVPERTEVLKILSSQAAISIENAKLYKMAITDSLTGLFTHKHFYYVLKKEVAKSKRYDRVFSLVMFDIDHFKHINDIYGHQAGDKILVELSNMARKAFRSADIISRYGGEEFVILLVETDQQGALIAAERFRKKVESTTFYYEDQSIYLTISFGISEFPTHAKDEYTLIKFADNALYLSKKCGRNKICVGEEVQN